MCGFNLKERKKDTDLRESLGLEPVSLSIKTGRLRWFGQVGHVDDKDDTDWTRRSMMMETEGTRQRHNPIKSTSDFYWRVWPVL